MAVLSSAGVEEVLRRLIKRWGSDPNRPQINKTMARAAIVGIDAYLNTNAAALNQAIPAQAGGRDLRSELTNAWKARFFAEVALQRYEEA